VDAIVIVNLESSHSRSEQSKIEAALSERGVRIVDFQTVVGGRVAYKRVKRAVKRGASVVIVGGGDGTMTQVVNALAHSETTLGVLPLGTGNSFAQTLGIGESLEAAADVIAGGRVASVDLGIVNGRYFANFATIGLAAQVAGATSSGLKRFVGPLAYALAGIGPLFTHRAFKATIDWKGGHTRLRTQQLIVASGRLFGKTPVLPNADITSGKLALFTSTATSVIGVLRTYLAFAFGAQTTLPDARGLSAKKIVVRTRPKQPLNVDGDAFGSTPACFRIARRALRVFVPASFVDEGH
jgi:YegS/Rv2252/BmrU family lipid kinase